MKILSEDEFDGYDRNFKINLWWKALRGTDQALNLSVDRYMEKMWEDFYTYPFDKDNALLSESYAKEISFGSRGWQRRQDDNFNGGLKGKGHERRWLTEDFIKRLALGINTDGEIQRPTGMAVTGLQKFTLGRGCWAAEISLGCKP